MSVVNILFLEIHPFKWLYLKILFYVVEWKTLLTGETTERLEVSLLAATFGSHFWTSLLDVTFGRPF